MGETYPDVRFHDLLFIFDAIFQEAFESIQNNGPEYNSGPKFRPPEPVSEKILG